jgi:hypothetical protein
MIVGCTGLDTDKDYGDNLFALESLKGGQYPWRDWDIATAAPWLPPLPHESNKIAVTHWLYQSNAVVL